MDVRIQVDDARINLALQRLIRLGRNMAPVMRGITRLGEASTRQRFKKTQTSPEGKPWKPSLRVEENQKKGKRGGPTLTRGGHLRDSISGRFDATTAEWGVNRVYAAIHQFGGVIRPKKAKGLRLRLANDREITRKSMTMPARPYLGISDDDRAGILDLIRRRFAGAAGGAVHAR